MVEPQLGHEWFVGRLAIPYVTRGGVCQMKFRAMNGEEPKYAGLPGVGPHLYGVQSLFTDANEVGITEGELDAALLTHQVGIPSVGCPGASVWRDHFPRLFVGFDRVLVFADGDDPGRALARRISADLPNAVVIDMPDGMDVTDVYVKEGPESLRERCGIR